jgi:hypothetical protein
MIQAYVAGKYTADNPEDILRNVTTALEAGVKIARARGWMPIVPHTMGLHTASWEAAMCRCRQTIREMRPHHDVMVLLPGWEKSRGAREEKALAEVCDLKVMTLAEAIGEAAL